MSILKEIQERREQLYELTHGTVQAYKKKALGDIMGADDKTLQKRVRGLKSVEKREKYQMDRTKGGQSFKGAADGRTLKYKDSTTARPKMTKEEVEHLEEGGNQENKFKKNVAVAKMGAKSNLVTGKDVDHEIMARSNNSSKAFASKQVADSLKRSGRRELNRPSDSPIRATYKNGTYHAVHGKTGKVVDTNISDSGGRALSHVDHLNSQYRKGKLKLEELSPAAQALIEDAMKRRGRPKKRRNLAGEIVEDTPKS